MNYDKITIKDFCTDLYVASFLSKNYRPIEGFRGFTKGDREVVLFDKELYSKYQQSYKCLRIYGMTPIEYLEFKSSGVIHKKNKQHSTVLYFDEDFFSLKGKENSKLRYYRNYYSRTVPIRIEEEASSLEEVEFLIRGWKKIKLSYYPKYRAFIGYDINFLNKYYLQNQDRLISRFFYYNDRLVGYFIVEKIGGGLYNQLFRKVNNNYGHLCLFVDLVCFQTIYNDSQSPFLVNLEGDIGQKGLRKYKTENFPVFKLFETYNIKIKREDNYENN